MSYRDDILTSRFRHRTRDRTARLDEILLQEMRVVSLGHCDTRMTIHRHGDDPQ